MIQSRKGTSADIEGILALQAPNLVSNMSEAQRKAGFVTTPFTPQRIEAIIAQDGLFVAEHDGQIVSYVFAGSWQYFAQWEIFNYMVSRFPLLKFKGGAITTINSFQYGLICIHKDYRGQGLINQIFETMRLVLVKRYPISLTFINKMNVISTKAHTQKLGWTIVDEFEFNDNTYIALAFDMNQSVL